MKGEAGRLWIGTAGGGLACLINGHGPLNTSNGLPSEIVAGVVEDQAKNLWLATGAGLYRVNRGDLRKTLDNLRIPLVCKLISERRHCRVHDGFRRTARSAVPDGDLWFATSKDC